jgi:hypothetical protein
MEDDILAEILEIYYEYEERKKAKRKKFWELFKL